MERIIKHYDTLAEFVAVARKFPRSQYNHNSIFDGMSITQACDYVLRGASEGQTKPIQELLAKIDSAVHGRRRDEWVPSVEGAYPVVPEYLMGMPENMRTRVRMEDDRAPIVIYVESSLSGLLSAEATARRGAAIAALAMRMGEERPVELRVFKTSQTSRVQVCWTAKLDTHPVNAAQCMAVFGTGAFCRAVGWAYLWHHHGRESNRINFGFGTPGGFNRANQIRRVFNMNPQDIIIEAGYAPDERLLQTDPVTWVHKQLEKQREIQD